MRRFFLIIILVAALSGCSHYVDNNLRIIETSDVHGQLFPVDMVTGVDAGGSLARVASYVKCLRDSLGSEYVVLLDNGDILQGQPSVYYYNYIDTVSPHLVPQMLKYMEYDASTIGNHDVETGHPVYDRFITECLQPILGANVIDVSTGKPYLKPYTVIDRGGLRIAVLGLITPAIPAWLPEPLWSGLRFDDMVETASRYVPMIIADEKPDIMAVLAHSGHDASKSTGQYVENAGALIAEQVPGIDIVMMGHDHQPYCRKISNIIGDSVLMINPGNNALNVADIEVKYRSNSNGAVQITDISGSLVPMKGLMPDTLFITQFAENRKGVEDFVNEKIGYLASSMSTRDAYFGPSAFVDFIHSLQIAMSGADISFAAPLSFDATLPAGDLYVKDMFSLYKYENTLYVMEMSGQEIKNYLEMAYDMWTNQMHSADDHLLRLKGNSDASDMTHTGFVYPSYTFDSAAGIIYTVDVTKPRGEKVTIVSMADGTPFVYDKTYNVAMNSYRGNGGGDLMTEGAGIPADELNSRLVYSLDHDLRFYMMQYIKAHPDINPHALDTWKFIPDSIVLPAAERDRKILFGDR